MVFKTGTCKAAVFALVVVGLLVAPHSAAIGPISTCQAAEEQSENILTEQERTQLMTLSRAIRRVAQSVRSSVVHIEVKEFIKRGESGPQSQIPEELREQWRRRFGDRMPFFFERPPAPTERTRKGIGSGIIFDNKGHILTNNHVVEGADKVEVTTTEGEEFDAELIGTDPLTDMAVLKIKAKGLKPARFGDSDKIEVGDLVIAVGNPFGFDYSVTLGIISAKGRHGMRLGRIYYQNFLQTDAAINPGNSGGPLVNIQGEVVGVNTAIVTQTGQYAGVSFAIPASLARKIADILIKEGEVTRGWLGVQIQEMSTGLAKSFGLDDTEGALITEVVPDSPAAKAKFKAGDIILEMNGEPIKNPNQLQQLVTFTPPETKVTFKVWRDRKAIEREVQLGQLKEEYLRRRVPGRFHPDAGKEEYEDEQLGVTVVTPAEKIAKELGWSKTPEGALVVEVDPAGEAADLRIEKGNVIVSVQGKAVRSAEDFAKAMEKVSLAEGFQMRVIGHLGGARFLWVQKQ